MASAPPGRKKTRAKKSKIPPRDTLTEQQRKEIEEAFDILDTEGSGRIDQGDLHVALRALGFEPRKDEVKKLMSDNDKENSGTINKQQFVEIFRAKWGETDPPDLLNLAFQLYDTEESGTLSLDNLQQITEMIGEGASVEELQEMMNEAAGVKNGDENAWEISVEQFMKIMVHQPEKTF
mmetsp:Transcript_54491/g.111183  ORF Transcript_54491/g.111183 Transcript_54491/m.111183 type:complete len:179 (-) Transcript_54491:145-681(-)